MGTPCLVDLLLLASLHFTFGCVPSQDPLYFRLANFYSLASPFRLHFNAQSCKRCAQRGTNIFGGLIFSGLVCKFREGTSEWPLLNADALE